MFFVDTAARIKRSLPPIFRTAYCGADDNAGPTDTFGRRLSRVEKEQMYLESKTGYRRYGVSDRPMPADYAAFEQYWDHMISEVLVAHPTARYGVGYVTKGSPGRRASRR